MSPMSKSFMPVGVEGFYLLWWHFEMMKGGYVEMKITELKSNEGGLHYYNKGYLMYWIVNKEVIFQDQDGYRFVVDIDRLGFGSMESYVYKNTDSLEPYYSGQCCDCIKEMFGKITKKKHDKLFDVRFDDTTNGDWNKNIIIMDHDYDNGIDYTYYKSHPCNFCRYKGAVDCILIFDIAFARKGEIKIAIEVENTSPVKWNKLKFCKENNITLVEVKAKDINNVTLRQNKIIYGHILYKGDSMGTNGLKYI